MADETLLEKLVNDFPVNVGDTNIRPVAMSSALAELIASAACEKRGGVWKCETKWWIFRTCSCTPKESTTSED